MSHDGSNPLTDALGDAAQKGAGLAAIAMQLVAERQRLDAARSTRSGQAGAPGEEGSPAKGTGEPARHGPGGGSPPAGQLHAGPDQDYLGTQRRWKDAFELDFSRADGRKALHIWLESAQHSELYPSAREAAHLAGRRLEELDPAFAQALESRRSAGVNPIVALQLTARDQLQLPEGRGPDALVLQVEPGRSATLDPAVEGQRQAALGLSADEEHAGLLMKGALDNPATPANERIDGLVESGERFQVAEASQAHAAGLTSLSYPHPVEKTMAAVRSGPAPRTSAKPGVVQDRKRGLSV